MAPIESSVLAQSGENKHLGVAGPANQNQAFKHRIIFPPEQSIRQDGGRSCQRTFSIQMVTSDYLK